jgi:hypothetical protein
MMKPGMAKKLGFFLLNRDSLMTGLLFFAMPGIIIIPFFMI